MKPIQAVIFDLDGTILDTLTDLTNSVNYALTSESLPPVESQDVRRFLGNGMERLIRLSIARSSAPDPALADALYARLFPRFREHYALHSQDNTCPYEGIIPLLTELRSLGLKTAVVSNKGDFAVHPLIDSHFPGLFDFACGEKEGIRRKPAPDSVNECLRVLGLAAEDAIYVGDSEVDIETAKNAHMPCLTVTWGFRDKEDLLAAGATILMDRPSDIIEWLYH